MVTEDVVRSWRAGLEDLFACFAGRFSRVEPRRYAQAYIRGLLAPLERKNGWTLAEASGFRSPNGLQDFLQSPAWDPNLVRDDLRDYVVEHLGQPDGVLIADETGFLSGHVLYWSTWRRRRQAQAKACHYPLWLAGLPPTRPDQGVHGLGGEGGDELGGVNSS